MDLKKATKDSLHYLQEVLYGHKDAVRSACRLINAPPAALRDFTLQIPS
jgi:hypothetical protein